MFFYCKTYQKFIWQKKIDQDIRNESLKIRSGENNWTYVIRQLMFQAEAADEPSQLAAANAESLIYVKQLINAKFVTQPEQQ